MSSKIFHWFFCRVKILLQAQNKHYKQLGVASSLKKVVIVLLELKKNIIC